MSEIKWIKVMTDMFDNRKIKQIETLPEADSIIVIWLKLLCLAGSVNEQGLIYFTKEIPYTDEMLAKAFDRPLNTVRLALQTFERFEMIEIIDNIICISNWEKYQQLEGMDKVREQNRIRKQRQRERQKQALLVEKENVTRDSHVTVTESHATDIDIEKDKEKDISISIYQTENPEEFIKSVFKLFIDLCPSFPKPRKETPTRIETIQKLAQEYTLEDFKEAFKNLESSDYLKNGWFDFDKAIDDQFFVNLLENKYRKYKKEPEPKKSNTAQFNNFNQRQDMDFDAIEKKMTGGV
jgi:predicted phage replisome organizer